MTPNETLALLIQSLSNGMTMVGYPISVLSSFQPTTQGTPVEPYLAITCAASRRYGYPQVLQDYNEATDMFDRVETYWLEETYQVTAYAISNPADVASPTAYVYATRAAAVLQSALLRGILLGVGVGFIRITDIRTPYFVNDRGQHEMTPSFDYTISRKEELVYSIPALSGAGVNIQRV